MDWVDLALDTDGWRALVNTVQHIVVPLNAGYFVTNRGPVSCTGRTPLLVVRFLVSFSLVSSLVS